MADLVNWNSSACSNCGYPWSSLSQCFMCSFQYTHDTLDNSSGENQLWKCTGCQYIGTFDAQCPCYFRGENWWNDMSSQDEDPSYHSSREITKFTADYESNLPTDDTSKLKQYSLPSQSTNQEEDSCMDCKNGSQHTDWVSDCNTVWRATCKNCGDDFSLFTSLLDCSCGLKVEG